jgi:hypothetical protein
VDQRRLQLAISHSQLVERAVRQCAPAMPRHLDLVDLSVRGRLGLLAAAEDYDLDGDTPFAEFALARIRDEVEQAVTDDSSGPDVGGLSELTVTDLTATDRSVTDEPAIELSAIDLSARRDHRVR